MTGAYVRNAWLALMLLLWISIAWEINAYVWERVSGHYSTDLLIFYVLTPAIVIPAGLVVLALRWRHRLSVADILLVLAPVLLLPVYLLPLQ